MDSAAEQFAHLTLNRSSDFQPAWIYLLSCIAIKNSNGVRQWCEIWKTLPESTQTEIMGSRRSPMYEAANIGDVDIIEVLVKYGFHPNPEGNLRKGYSPIHTAARNDHLDVVKKLVEDFSVPVDTGASYDVGTALMWAVKSNHTDVAKYLINKGANANYVHRRHDPRRIYLSPLLFAVIKNSMENANLLLDSGADVNLRISKACSVLNRAVTRGYLEMVRLLCSRGAKLDVVDDDGLSIMHNALGSRSNLALIRYLIELNVSLDGVSVDGYTPLCHGLRSAVDSEVTLKWATLLLDAGHQLSRQDYNKVRVLIKGTGDQLERIDDLVEDYLSVPRTLQQLCCFRIRRSLGTRLLRCIDYLPLPLALRRYICLKHL